MKPNLHDLAMVTIFVAIQSLEAATTESQMLFRVEETNVNVTMGFSNGDEGSDTPIVSGDFYATVEYDEDTLAPQSFTFHWGAISLSDLDLFVDSNLFIEGAGNVDIDWTLSGGMTFVPATPFAPGGISSETGELSSADHSYDITDGQLLLTATLLGETIGENIDYAGGSTALILSSPPKLTITAINANELSRTLRFELEFEYNNSESETLDGSDISVTIRESGLFVATAEETRLTDLGRWAEDAGLDSADLNGSNKYGIPYRLLYLLDKPSYDNGVFYFLRNENGNTVYLTEGSNRRAKVFPETIYQAGQHEWSPVPTEWIRYGLESLEPRSDLPIEIRFPDSTIPTLIRFRVDEVTD